MGNQPTMLGELPVDPAASVDATTGLAKLIVAAATAPASAEGTKATYSAAVFGNAPAATPTDFWTILGSATKIVRVQRIWIVGRATAASWYRVRLLKYSTAYSAGTPAAVTRVPHDSADTAATAVVQTWSSGLPTVGTLVGAIHDDDCPLNIATLTTTQPFVPAPGLLYDFGIRNSKGLKLKDNTEYLALNGNAVALPSGAVFDIKVEFTEE